MKQLIDYRSYPVADVLPKLVKDMTTGKNIILATNAYAEIYFGVSERTEITAELLMDVGNEYTKL